MKVYFTLTITLLFCIQLFSQSFWTVDIEPGVVKLEEANDGGIWLYYAGQLPEDNYRTKIDLNGNFEFNETFILEIPEYYYEFDGSRLKRKDTIDGSILWEVHIGEYWPGYRLHVTNSGIVFIFYVTSDVNSAAFLKIYDKSGNLISNERCSPGSAYNECYIRYLGAFFDGSFLIKIGNHNNSPSSGVLGYENIILFDKRGAKSCERDYENRYPWITTARSEFLFFNNSGNCREYRSQIPGDNTNDPHGLYHPCSPYGYLYTQGEILMPYGPDLHIIGMSAGGYAAISGLRLQRSICGFWTTKGTVYSDENSNCKIDFGDKPIENFSFEFEGEEIKTDENGNYSSSTIKDGGFQLEYSFSQDVLSKWIPCESNWNLDIRYDDRDQFDILLVNKDNIIDNLTVDIGTSSTELCDSTSYEIRYCNSGLKKIDSVFLKIEFPNELEFLDSEPSPVMVLDNIVTYFVDSLNVADCEEINFKAFNKCDSSNYQDLAFNLFTEFRGFTDTSQILLPITTGGYLFIQSLNPTLNSNLDFLIEIGTPLVYQFNFKNTTGDTVDVNEIRLEFFGNVDFENLEILSSSHVFTKGNSRILETDIKLPPNNIDPINSSGVVRFSIPYDYGVRPIFRILSSAFIEGLGYSNQDTVFVGPNILTEILLDTTLCHYDFISFPTVEFNYEDQDHVNIIYYNKDRFPDNIDTLRFSGCFGDTIFYQGLEMTYTRKYEAIEQDLNGCDSGLVVFPIFHPVFSKIKQISVSPGDFFNGILINQDTVIQEIFVDRNGCDSTYIFEISILSKIDDLDLIITKVNVFPNPVKDLLSVNFFGRKNEELTLRVVDVLGKTHTKLNFETRLGENQIEIETDLLLAGVYYLVFEDLEQGTNQTISKFVKI